MSGLIFSGLSCRFTRIPEQRVLRICLLKESRPLFARMMKFYNRRLVSLAKNGSRTGIVGSRNAGWRELYDGFVPDIGSAIDPQRFLRWWKCELVIWD